MPKIAFYFFGQMRNTQACIPYFIKNVLNTCPYEYDIFISTWKNNLNQTNIDYLTSKLKPRIFELLDFDQILDENKDYIKQIEDASHVREVFYIRYSMLRNYENIIKYEKENHQNYTHMFQIRTDMLIYNPFPWETLDFNSDTIYVKNAVHVTNVDDEFTFAKKESMRVYVDFYKYLHIFDLEVFRTTFHMITSSISIYLHFCKKTVSRINLDYWLVRCLETNGQYVFDLQPRDNVVDLPQHPYPELIQGLNTHGFVNWKVRECLFNRAFTGKEYRSHP